MPCPFAHLLLCLVAVVQSQLVPFWSATGHDSQNTFATALLSPQACRVKGYWHLWDSSATIELLGREEPLVDEPILIACNGLGQIAAVNVAKNSTQWRIDPPSNGLSCPVLSNDGKYLYVQGVNHLTCLHASKGTVVWATSASEVPPDTHHAAPVLSSDGTIVLYPRPTLTAAVSASGNLLWFYPMPLSFAPGQTFPVSNHTAILSNTTAIAAVDLRTGTERWLLTAATSNEVVRHISDGGTVIVQSNGTTLVGLELQNGAQRWVYPTGCRFQSAVVDNLLFAACSARLMVLDAESGSLLHSWPTDDPCEPAGLTVSGTGLLVACESAVQLRSQADGSLAWSVSIPGGNTLVRAVPGPGPILGVATPTGFAVIDEVSATPCI